MKSEVIQSTIGPIRIVEDPNVPIDEIQFRHPDGRVDRMINIGFPQPTSEECEQIWSAVVEAYRLASPPVKRDWTPKETALMRVAAGRAAWEKVNEILRNRD